MTRWWTIWKHALGTYSDEDVRDHENAIACIRTGIVIFNLVTASLIMANIIIGWL